MGGGGGSRSKGIRVVVFDMIQQAMAARLNHIQNMIKALGTAIVGVRDIETVAACCKGHEQVNPVTQVGRGEADQGLLMAAIHRDEIVKVREIIAIDPPGPLGRQIDSAMAGRFLRSVVRRIADMPAAGSCRINVEVILQAAALDKMAKDPFGGRRATDIAGADEQDPDGGAGLGTGRRALLRGGGRDGLGSLGHDVMTSPLFG